MKQKIYEIVTQFYARIKKNQIIRTNTPFVKVNLGSGLAVAQGWINVDGNINALFAHLPKFTHKMIYRHTGNKNWYSEEEYISKLRDNIFVHHRLDYGMPFQKESIDVVYSSHFFEHLYKNDAIKLMKEVYNCLKPGGIFRLNIPDLEYAVKLYLRGEKEQALEYFFVDSINDIYSKHYYLYDFEMVREILENIGFREITRCEYKKGQTPDLEILDVRPDGTLFIEAFK